MRIDVLTIFPEIFPPVLQHSIVKRAQASGQVAIHVHDLRDYTTDRHRTVDDRPYGGGPGMVMKPEPIVKAVEAIEANVHGIRPGRSKRSGGLAARRGCEVILMSPDGEPFRQTAAKALSRLSHMTLICGHYEGVDERVRQLVVSREISIGDYVLTGGELPAMVVIDAIVRLRPGVLGHDQALVEESFEQGLLEYPQYTRPVSYRGLDVPDVLRSGHHHEIMTWRNKTATAKTSTRRPDLVRRPPNRRSTGPNGQPHRARH